MHVDYNEGANPWKAQQALQNYGLSYNNYLYDATYRMSWDNLRLNINNKYPVYVSAKASNSGNGSTISAAFKENGTTFAYNNTTYTWTYSVSQY